jgi:mono/diheme cytochrome c family protein
MKTRLHLALAALGLAASLAACGADDGSSTTTTTDGGTTATTDGGTTTGTDAGTSSGPVTVAGVLALTGDAANGQTVYANSCQACHGLTGNSMAPAAGKAKSDVSGAAEIIVSGNGAMPSFGRTLTNQQIADVIAHLKTL